MLETLGSIKNIILNFSMFLPFIFAILLSLGFFIKNPIHIRNLANCFFGLNFTIVTVILFLTVNFDFTLFNQHFCLDSAASLILFFSALIFMLFSIFSKNIITKLHRTFYSSLILLLGIIQALILVDNVFLSFALIFWTLLIFYFIQYIYTKTDKRKSLLKFKLIEDCFIFLAAIFLMGYDFIRYFLINNINFDYSNISDNLYHISDFSIVLAFIGFCVLIFRFFNLFPFNNFKIKNLSISETLITIINITASILIGLSVLGKIYSSFDYLIYHYQEFIAFYFIFNFIYYLILSLQIKSLLGFLINSLIPNIIIGLFSLFMFNNEGISQCIYYILSLTVSYLLLGFIFIILINKFKTDFIDDFKKITQKSLKFIFLFSFLNLARTPFLLMFSSTFTIFTSIFALDYDGFILNISTYILIFGLFLIILSLLNLTYKILIEPNKNPNFKLFMSKSSAFCCYILIFLTIVMTLGYSNIYNLISNSYNFGS